MVNDSDPGMNVSPSNEPLQDRVAEEIVGLGGESKQPGALPIVVNDQRPVVQPKSSHDIVDKR